MFLHTLHLVSKSHWKQNDSEVKITNHRTLQPDEISDREPNLNNKEKLLGTGEKYKQTENLHYLLCFGCEDVWNKVHA